MLTSLTVYSFPIENAILPPTTGHYIHAAFLDILNQIDTKVAEWLHNDQPCKPFTVSPLQGKFEKQGKEKLLIRAGTRCWMRFTILGDDLLSIVTRFFLEGNSSIIRLGNSKFQITKTITDESNTNESWSGYTSFKEILDSTTPSDRINIRFYSPTAFKIHNPTNGGHQNYVFPDQIHCFHSWLRKWNEFSPMPFDEDTLLDFIQRYIRLSKYSIKTKIMNFGGYKQLGFIGDCEYQFVPDTSTGKTDRKKDKMLEFMKQTNALATFSFYCGTGYKTTMGMGQTRRREPTRAVEVVKDLKRLSSEELKLVL